MLSYFPQPYPDELLYSVIARLQAHTLMDARHIRQLLFGKHGVGANVDLPCGLQHLKDSVGDRIALSAEEIAEHLTPLPYYAACCSPAKAAALKQRMLKGNGRGFYPHSLQGGSSSTDRWLRHCPHCAAQDLATYGETYWRRLFQLPGVVVCPDHGQVLVESRRYRSAYSAAFVSAGTVAEDAVKAAELTNEQLRMMKIVADRSRMLLDATKRQQVISAFPDKRRAALDRGYAKVSSALDRSQMCQDFEALFGAQLLETLGCSPSQCESQGGSWLTVLTTGRSAPKHTLRMLLFDVFIESRPRRAPPFGNGPWPCFNALADHFGQNKVKVMDFKRSGDSGRLMARFRCDCGYEYGAHEPVEGEPLKPSIVYRYGPVYKSKVIQMLEAGWTAFSIGRALSIRRHLVPKIVAGEDNVRTREDGIVLRRARKESDEQDRWRRRAGPVDWEARDGQLSLQVERTAQELRDAQPPERVTRKRISRRLVGNGLLFTPENLKKLPLTARMLDDICEAVDESQLRRLNWAAKQFQAVGRPITKIALLRKARIRPDRLPPYLKEAVEQLLPEADSVERATSARDGQGV